MKNGLSGFKAALALSKVAAFSSAVNDCARLTPFNLFL
jgi:hypothetical protein